MKTVLDILKGVVIGIANAVPGVSGGTMMVSMKIYDKVIHAVNTLTKNFKESIKTLWPYIAGMVLGILLSAVALGFFFEKFPVQTALLFLGLMFGGIPVIYKKAADGKITVKKVVIFLVAAALLTALQFLGNGADNVVNMSFLTFIILYLVGTVASAAMVVPGVSGAMILVVLGYYNAIIDAVSGFLHAVLSADIPLAFSFALILIPVGLGVLSGIFGSAKLIDMLFKKAESETYSAILGLIAASPVSIFMNMNITSPITGAALVWTVITGVILMITGFIASYIWK